MGLTIVVGVLAGADDGDADHVRGHLAVIGDLLDRVGAGPWAEPELNEQEVLEGDMWGYSGLHTIRRLAVHLAEAGILPDRWRNLIGRPTTRCSTRPTPISPANRQGRLIT